MSTPTILDGINIDELITDAALEEYWRRGYWISPKLFGDDQIAELAAGAGTTVARGA